MKVFANGAVKVNSVKTRRINTAIKKLNLKKDELLIWKMGSFTIIEKL